MISDFYFGAKDKAVFDAEFANRIPDVLIDNHIHIWTKECLNISKEEYSIYKKYKPWTDFDFMEEFRVEEFYNYSSQLFPGKKYFGTFFGLIFPQVDIEKNNQYVMQQAEAKKTGFYYIPGQFEDMYAAAAKLHLLERSGFLGFKPYPDLAHVDHGEPGIYDMLNRSILEFANQHELTIVLHIPRKNRLHSPENKRELEEIVTKYSNVHFILAHVARSFCYYDVEGTIDFLVKKDNVSFDTTLINDAAVLEYLMRKVDSSKIIYGTDAPLAFCRGKDVCINNKHYYVTERITPWGLGPMDKDFVDFTYYVYEEIRALLYASRAVYGKDEERHLERIFYSNSKKILDRRGVKYA